MTHTLERCPLCGSAEIRAYKVGWAVVTCLTCHLTLARPMDLDELIRLWNTRAEIVRTVPEQVELF